MVKTADRTLLEPRQRDAENGDERVLGGLLDSWKVLRPIVRTEMR